MSCLSVYFRGLFRPSTTKVRAVVYANGKECDISKYDEFRIATLLESIQILWHTPENSSIWFETEAFVERKCFKKPETTIYVICYKQDMFANNFKSEVGIPIKYRQKMFDKAHTIMPMKGININWPETMKVRFRLVE